MLYCIYVDVCVAPLLAGFTANNKPVALRYTTAVKSATAAAQMTGAFEGALAAPLNKGGAWSHAALHHAAFP